MADNLPEYTPSVSYDVQSPSDISKSVQYMIKGFKEFGNQANSLIDNKENQIAAEDKQQLQYNISKTYNDFANQALLNPDKNKALEDYQAQSKDYSDGLQQVAGNQKQFVQNLTGYYSDQHYNPLLKQALFQNKRIDLVNNIAKLDQLGKDMIDAAKNPNTLAGSSQGDPNSNPDFAAAKQQNDNDLSAGNITQEQHDQRNSDLLNQYGNQEPTQQFAPAQALAAKQVSLIKKMVISGELEPETGLRAINAVQQKLVVQQLSTEYQKAVQTGTQGQFLENLAEHSPHGWTFNQTHQVIAQLIRQSADIAKAQGLNATVVNGQVKANIANIENNGAIPDETVRQNVGALNPMALKDYDTNIRDAQTVHEYRQAWLSGDPKRIAQMMSLMNVNPNDPDAIHQQILNGKINKSLAQLKADYVKDPLKYEMQQPYFQQAMSQAKMAQDANASSSHLQNTPVNSVLATPQVWQQVIQSQMQKGLTPYGGKNSTTKLMTNQDALNGAAFVNNPNSSPQDISNYFSSLRSQYANRQQYNLVLKQLSDNGMSPRMQFRATLDPSTPGIDQITQSLAMPVHQLEKGIDPTQLKALKQQVQNDVYNGRTNILRAPTNLQLYMNTLQGNSGGRDPEFLQGVHDSIYSMALHFMQTGQASNYTGATTMAENFFANRYKYTNVGSQTIAVPNEASISPQAVSSYANQKARNIGNIYFSPLPTQAPLAQQKYDANIKAGHFANGSDDHTLVWVGKDGNAPPMANGLPYTIDMRDAQNGNTNVAHPDLNTAHNVAFKQNFAPQGAQALQSVSHKSFQPFVQKQALSIRATTPQEQQTGIVNQPKMTGTQVDVQKFQSFIQKNTSGGVAP